MTENVARRQRRTFPRGTPFLDRFWGRVEVRGECWEWTGTKISRGYGAVPTRTSRSGQPIAQYAHRLSWELAHAQPIPAGMLVCHHCDNPPCVRPDHLFLGTSRDNTLDMLRKGRGGRVRGGRPNQDLTGKRIGTRTIVALVGHDGQFFIWRARCDCGAVAIFRRDTLTTLCACTPSPRERIVALGGVSRNLNDWAQHLGISRQAMDMRLRNGWSLERACTTPRSPGVRKPRKLARRKAVAEALERLRGVA